MPLKIFYIHGVGQFGGSSRSLYETVKILSTDKIEPFFLVQRGSSNKFFRKISKNIICIQGLSRFDNTRYSHYRGLRWIVLLREIYYIPFTIFGLLKAKRQWPTMDIIHVNEITEIFTAFLAKFIFNAPIVIHVRSLQNNDHESKRTRLISYFLSKADAVIAIDFNVRDTLPQNTNVHIIHNAFTPTISNEDNVLKNKLMNLPLDKLKVGFVGNLLLLKGILDLVSAIELINKEKNQIILMVLGGSVNNKSPLMSYLLDKVGLKQDITNEINQKIRSLSLGGRLLLLGHSDDISAFYKEIDILCFPSHLDAAGRPVLEAAFFKKPSIVAVTKPKEDTLVDGQTGIAIPIKSPPKIKDAILHFLHNPSEISRMGNNAYDLATSNFDAVTNAEKLYDVYQSIKRS